MKLHSDMYKSELSTGFSESVLTTNPSYVKCLILTYNVFHVGNDPIRYVHRNWPAVATSASTPATPINSRGLTSGS